MKRGQCPSWLTSGGLSGPHPVSSHFTHLPYATGTPPASALVVVPGVGVFVYALGFPEKLAVSSNTPTLTGFTVKSYEDFFSQHWSPGVYGLAWGWAHSLIRCVPDFYPPHVNVGLPILLATTSLSLCLSTPPAPLLPHRVLSILTPCFHPSYPDG